MSEALVESAIIWRLVQLEQRTLAVERKVDRLTIAIVGAALTFAVGVSVGVLVFVWRPSQLEEVVRVLR